jgi:hypothetical protein
MADDCVENRVVVSPLQKGMTTAHLEHALGRPSASDALPNQQAPEASVACKRSVKAPV